MIAVKKKTAAAKSVEVLRFYKRKDDNANLQIAPQQIRNSRYCYLTGYCLFQEVKLMSHQNYPRLKIRSRKFSGKTLPPTP